MESTGSGASNQQQKQSPRVFARHSFRNIFTSLCLVCGDYSVTILIWRSFPPPRLFILLRLDSLPFRSSPPLSSIIPLAYRSASLFASFSATPPPSRGTFHGDFVRSNKTLSDVRADLLKSFRVIGGASKLSNSSAIINL